MIKALFYKANIPCWACWFGCDISAGYPRSGGYTAPVSSENHA